MRRATGSLLVLGVVVVLMLGALVGWRLLDPARTYEPDSQLADQCDDVPGAAERITLVGKDGVELGGAVVGPEGADVGVVLRQGAGQTICQWLPWAGDVADATGARVLLFDRRGSGSSPGDANLGAEPDDVLTAVKLLNDEGTTQVALAGSSMGNSVMFTALDRMASAPCAVVSISPVLTASDGHGTVDGTVMDRLPANVWLTWEHENSAIMSNAELILSRSRDEGLPTPNVLEVDTGDHSIGLVNKHPEVRDFLVEAVRSCQGAIR
jgi:pimeloyl-ACP methyl ester carboxylesterase